ncbi:MAG: methyltransferase domain-containing protein [Mycobacterium sp.]|uniref:class I SAM-dependent methyltransferase n=1 Tax=Mycobacterium sp. TaxID=1785 RepID=UPI00260B9302|nr:methyltransferase domain-containing protein [Mycobacterium sp.]MDI3313294.1 methyltransferase domain-containing protein [Mycobacterium sp.]
MAAPQRRSLNSAVTRLWSFAAPVYDFSLLQHWVYRPAHDEVITQLRAHRAGRIADVGCGTGILADRIERELHPEEIYGVDLSEGMLAVARARSTRVQWVRSPAERLPFADGALDAIVTTSAFHFFHQEAALREFSRVLAPGGLLAVAALTARRPLLPGTLGWKPAHHAPAAEVRALFESAGFVVREQHRVRRPAWTRIIPDVITVGTKPSIDDRDDR